MNLSITPGINNVGAYINDIDLKILNKEQAKEIKNILNQFGVVFIKKQNLDPESYQKFLIPFFIIFKIPFVFLFCRLLFILSLKLFLFFLFFTPNHNKVLLRFNQGYKA